MSSTIPPEVEGLLERPGPGSHRPAISVDGALVETLADLPPLRDRLLFVGLRPSPASVEAGHAYGDDGSRSLWEALGTADIVPVGTVPAAGDDTLVAAGHGLMFLYRVPAPRHEPSDAALRAGVGPLWQKVAIWRPAAVVFIDARAAEVVASRAIVEPWGQLDGVALSGRPCFLMPREGASAKDVSAGLNFLRNLGASLPR